MELSDCIELSNYQVLYEIIRFYRIIKFYIIVRLYWIIKLLSENQKNVLGVLFTKYSIKIALTIIKGLFDVVATDFISLPCQRTFYKQHYCIFYIFGHWIIKLELSSWFLYNHHNQLSSWVVITIISIITAIKTIDYQIV